MFNIFTGISRCHITLISTKHPVNNEFLVDLHKTQTIKRIANYYYKIRINAYSKHYFENVGNKLNVIQKLNKTILFTFLY